MHYNKIKYLQNKTVKLNCIVQQKCILNSEYFGMRRVSSSSPSRRNYFRDFTKNDAL